MGRGSGGLKLAVGRLGQADYGFNTRGSSMARGSGGLKLPDGRLGQADYGLR